MMLRAPFVLLVSTVFPVYHCVQLNIIVVHVFSYSLNGAQLARILPANFYGRVLIRESGLILSTIRSMLLLNAAKRRKHCWLTDDDWSR
jgi:hypothetical protein